MLISSYKNIDIVGMSVAVPNERVSVLSFEKTFGKEVVEGFVNMTGVESISRAKPEQTASDLGYEAAVDVLDKTRINSDDIGVLIFITQKPDFRVPSTAFLIHKRLGLSESCICFDINLACSGFIYSLQTAFAMLKNSDTKNALVITGDTTMRTLSPLDRSMIMLFGDSGTATVIEKTKTQNIVNFAFRTDGSRFKSIITPAGAYRSKNPSDKAVIWQDDIERSYYDTQMKGMDVFGFSISDVPKLMKEFMNAINVTSEDYDIFALHQANKYMLKKIAAKIKAPFEKVPISLDRFGNNSSNSVPLVLADHFGEKTNKKMRVFMSGFGAGLSWGCCDIKIDINTINPLVFTDKYYMGE